MSDIVTVQEFDHYALCTLNLPQKRNPISSEMRTALIAALESLSAKPKIRCVAITGAGAAFCSGLDLESLAAQIAKTPDEHRADSQSIADFFSYIVRYPKPTIAVVNGPAVAGGCGLALLCDITLMNAETHLSFSEVKIGFVPALVGVYLERMVGPKVSRELLFSARKLPAMEALEKGLVTAIVPPAELADRTAKMAHELAQNSPQAIARTKALLTRAWSASLAEAIAMAVDVNAEARSSSDCREGVNAFLQKRVPFWDQTV